VLFGYLGVAGLVMGYMAAQNARFRRRLRKNRVGQLSKEDQDRYLSGALTRYILTPDTLMWHESPSFKEGSGCEAIVDSNGVVLAMCEANG